MLMTPDRPVRSRVLAMRRVTDSVRALKIASWTAVGCAVMGPLMPVEVDHEAAGTA